MHVLLVLLLFVCTPPLGVLGTSTPKTEDTSASIFLGSYQLAELESQLQEVLEWGVETGVINENQSELLMGRLQGKTSCSFNEETIAISEEQAGYFLVNGLYFVGMTTVVGGLGFFAHYSFKHVSIMGITAFTGSFFALGLLFSLYLWRFFEIDFLAEICLLTTLAVIPLGVFAAHEKIVKDLKAGIKKQKTEFLLFFLSERGPRVIASMLTIACSFVVLLFARLPLLLLPNLASFYLLLLDLTYLYSAHSRANPRKSSEKRKKDLLSFLERSLDDLTLESFAVFGSLLIMVGVILDFLFESNRDWSFWLHIFGSSGLMLGLCEKVHKKWSATNQSTFLCACTLLIFLGYETPMPFLVFVGMIGGVYFWVKSIIDALTNGTNATISVQGLYIRLFFSVLFLVISTSQADNRHHLVFLLSLLGFFYYNIAWAVVPRFSGHETTELSYIPHLLSNLGILCLSNTYAYDIRWLGQTFPGKWILEMIVALGLIGNSTWALYYSRESKYAYLYQKIGIRSCFEVGIDVYVTWRILLAVAVIFASVPFRNDVMCWVGFYVLAIYLWLALFLDVPDYRVNFLPMLPKFYVAALMVILASLFDYTAAFLVGVGSMVYCMHFVLRRPLPFFYLVFATTTLAIILNSAILALVSGGSFLVLFAHTARRSFSKKVFGVCLVFLGGFLVFLVWEYQRHFEGVLRQTIVNFFVRMLREKDFSVDDYVDGMTGTWAVTDLAELIRGRQGAGVGIPGWMGVFLWPYTVATLLVSSSKWLIPFFPVALVIASIIRDVFFWYTAEEPLDLNSNPEIELTSWVINFPSDTGGNGFVFEFEANKPADLVPTKVSLFIEGEEFVSTLKTTKILPEKFQISPTNGPYKLMPKKMPRSCFQNGETTVKGYIQCGTGFNGESPIAQDLLRTGLVRMSSTKNPKVTITITYHTKNRTPSKGVLFRLNVQASQLLNKIRSRSVFCPLLEQHKWK
eukprot:TRINITY_DN4748_c0_g1_i1.p1 TRINITY_DN4748_c0_g1~~TRINITY_DN4748_c0_g1_i1.p1  ORF type:complete len:979 (-),score=147.21 TRINITY_DN4748_c0_g1_i1:18-2924(-)